MKKDEKLLQEKLTKKVSAEFETKFWKEFESINERERSGLKAKHWFGMAIPALVVILAVMVYQNQTPVKEDEMQLAMNAEMLEELDMLESLDTELIELSDEDWEVLLAQN